MAVQITVIGSPDRKLEELIRASGLRPTVASAVDLLALTHPAAPQPDILFVDIRPHGQVPAALGPIKRQHPALSIVLAASQLTPELMLEAMRAGVTECVAEPLTLEGIGGAISRIVAQRTSAVGGQVFAFVGAKGGVGTTTLAVNVATCFAQQRHSTLFIDMHPSYGDAAIQFGAEPKFSLTDALDNTHRLDLAFFHGLTAQTKGGVTLLASPDNTPTAPIDPHRIRLLLDFATRNYQFTVLDLPRSNPATLDTLEGAQNIFVVTNQELASVRGACRVADALSRRYTREKVSVVVSRVDKGAEISVEDIEDVVHAPVRFTFPSDYRVAVQALNEGNPFVLSDRGKLSNAVTAFARQLIGEPETAPTLSVVKALGARFGVLRRLATS